MVLHITNESMFQCFNLKNSAMLQYTSKFSVKGELFVCVYFMYGYQYSKH